MSRTVAFLAVTLLHFPTASFADDVSIDQDGLQLGYRPACYFPLVVGNHWKFQNQDLTQQEPSKWLFIDVTDAETLGVPGEGETSYRVEFSESGFGSADTSTFRITYFSVSENGDLGWTANEDDVGTRTVYDSLLVYLANPIIVGNAVQHEFGSMQYSATVEAPAHPIELPLPLEGNYLTLRVHEYSTVAGVPRHEEFNFFAPVSYWPVVGQIWTEGTHWESYPDLRRDFRTWLVESSILFDEDECPTTGVGGPSEVYPWTVRLFPTVPNPFIRATAISFEIRETSPLTLQVYDLAGRHVKTLKKESKVPAGYHTVTWQGRDDRGRRMPAGIYFIRLDSRTESQARKVILLD
jgi:hypothetical protein